MKKFLSGFLCCAVLCSIFVFTGNTIANSPIKLVVNGNTINCDVPPQIINGRVMVPARYVAENLGASVVWHSDYNTVVVTSNNNAALNDLPKNTNNAQAAQQQQIKKVKIYYEKVKSATNSVANLLENNPNIEELNAQIKALTVLENELTSWGTLDEYKEIKRLYMQCVNQMGNALIYTRSVLYGDNSRINSKIGIDYMLKCYDSVLQINAEIESLKIKGLL